MSEPHDFQPSSMISGRCEYCNKPGSEHDAQDKLDRIRALVIGVGRTDNPNNGMDMLANAVLRILDNPE